MIASRYLLYSTVVVGSFMISFRGTIFLIAVTPKKPEGCTNAFLVTGDPDFLAGGERVMPRKR